MTPLLNITATMVASIIILEIDNGNFHDDGSHYLEEKLANSTTLTTYSLSIIFRNHSVNE